MAGGRRKLSQAVKASPKFRSLEFGGGGRGRAISPPQSLSLRKLTRKVHRPAYQSSHPPRGFVAPAHLVCFAF